MWYVYLSVCLFVCPIITQEPLQILIGELGRATGMFLAWFWDSKSVGRKKYEIEGRYNWRGPPYHIIIHALQTGSLFV